MQSSKEQTIVHQVSRAWWLLSTNGIISIIRIVHWLIVEIVEEKLLSEKDSLAKYMLCYHQFT